MLPSPATMLRETFCPLTETVILEVRDGPYSSRRPGVSNETRSKSGYATPIEGLQPRITATDGCEGWHTQCLTKSPIAIGVSDELFTTFAGLIVFTPGRRNFLAASERAQRPRPVAPRHLLIMLPTTRLPGGRFGPSRPFAWSVFPRRLRSRKYGSIPARQRARY